MGIFDLFKQSSIQCPTCQTSFDVGPDFKALTDSAGAMIDRMAGLFQDNPFAALCEEIADHFDVPYGQAVEMVAGALDDEAVKDAVFEYLENDEDET